MVIWEVKALLPPQIQRNETENEGMREMQGHGKINPGGQTFIDWAFQKGAEKIEKKIIKEIIREIAEDNFSKLEIDLCLEIKWFGQFPAK